MTKRQETGMAWLAATVLIIACILMAMCSCGSEKVITETIYEHDTVTVHHSDTVKEVVYKSKVDTVTNTEEHVYYLNNEGEPVKEIHHYHSVEKTNTVDSTYRYQAERDSLRQALLEEKAREKTMTKIQVPWKWLCMILAAFFASIVFIVRDRK